MRFDRRAAGALAAGAFLLAGGGAALAASGKGDASATCDQRLAKAAEQRGVSIDQLKAEIQARLLARIDAAEKAGRLSPERATMLRDRVDEGSLCGARRHVRARMARHGLLRACGGIPRPRPAAAPRAAQGALARRSRRGAGQERARPRDGDARARQGTAREGGGRRKSHPGAGRHGDRPTREAREPDRDEGVLGLNRASAYRRTKGLSGEALRLL